jgi:hypothetical protein
MDVFKTYRRTTAFDRLDYKRAASLFLVAEVEVGVGDNHNDHDDKRASHASPETWLVAWLVLFSVQVISTLLAISVLTSGDRKNKPEHQATSDTANPSESHERRATKCALPLPANVVRLPAHHVRDVRVRSGAREEDSGVLSRDPRRPSHHRQADDGDDSVSCDNGPADAILVC